MPTRNRLLVHAYLDGALREPGYIFLLEDGALGPHKTVEHGSDVNDLDVTSETYGKRLPGAVKDMPLYEELPADAEIAPHVDQHPDARDGQGVEFGLVNGGEPYRYPSHDAAFDRYNNLMTMGENVTHVERRERAALQAKIGVVDRNHGNAGSFADGAMSGGTYKMEDERAAAGQPTAEERQAEETKDSEQIAEGEPSEEDEQARKDEEQAAARKQQEEEAAARKKREEDEAYAQIEREDRAAEERAKADRQAAEKRRNAASAADADDKNLSGTD